MTWRHYLGSQRCGLCMLFLCIFLQVTVKLQPCAAEQAMGKTVKGLLSAHVQSDLQKELQERGLPKTGTKAVLAERLHSALQEERQLLLSEPGEARDELHRQYLETLARCAHACRRISQEAIPARWAHWAALCQAAMRPGCAM